MNNKNLLIVKFLFLNVLFLSWSCTKEIVTPQYTLSVAASPNEAGTVNPSNGSFQEGQSVSITATPKLDFKFVNWSGSYTSVDNPLNIKMLRNETLTANFSAKPDTDGDGIPDDRDAEPNTRKGVPIDATGKMENPLYLDKNGETIKAKDWSVVGDKGIINGKEYEVVNRSILIYSRSDKTNLCTTKITDFSELFSSQSTFNQDISSWDVSNATNMQYLFSGATLFNQDLSKWDVSKVTTMRGMFDSAKSFNQDLSKWDVSKVTTMEGMFFGAIAFNQDLSKWVVSNVTSMQNMFNRATTFNQNISNWDVSNVTNMVLMFANSEFNNEISNWNVSRVETMIGMFQVSKFNQDISNWNVSNVTDMNGMFGFSKFNKDISNWNVGKVKNMGSMFYDSEFNNDLSKWDVGNVTNMQNMFQSAKSFNQDLSKWNVGKVIFCNQFSYLVTSWKLPKPTFINCKQ